MTIFLVYLIVVFILLLIAFAAISRNKKLYTRTNCSVCGKRTGHENNKRFILEDGYMCQRCAEKTTPKHAFVATYGPNAFKDETIETIKELITERTGEKFEEKQEPVSRSNSEPVEEVQVHAEQWGGTPIEEVQAYAEQWGGMPVEEVETPAEQWGDET